MWVTHARVSCLPPGYSTAQGFFAWMAQRQKEAHMASTFLSRTLPKTRRRWWLTASVLVIGFLAAFPSASADIIPDWNLITAQTLQTVKAGGGLNQSWVYAMVHGAMFDAVNA